MGVWNTGQMTLSAQGGVVRLPAYLQYDVISAGNSEATGNGSISFSSPLRHSKKFEYKNN